MFVGVLQSLFTVVNDLPFAESLQEEEMPAEEEDEYTDVEDEREQASQGPTSPFTVIGLNSMKLVIWNNMYDNVTDSTRYKNDLCLVIFVSAHFTDTAIFKSMNLLKESLLNESTCPSPDATANQLGDQLIPLVKYWFEEEHSMTAYQIPAEDEQLTQWSTTGLPQSYLSRKRIRTIEHEESITPPGKTIRLHVSVSNVLQHDGLQNAGKLIDASKLSTKDMLEAYKRIWSNLDLSKPTDAKLEPFVWQKIRQYQQKL
ncbi:hypothetical protein [Parasitella parasitica]|uniref:Uncharacterized protein n=1 Tax=Parasitella parasitica TaxID=35722 RepID=A0A0B7MXP4_9FUNG|nr:hypothetical protein [Parasitella parasitica]